MSEREINVEPMMHRPPIGNDIHVRTLAAMLEIYKIDQKGERIGSRERRKLVLGLPAELGGYKIDDFLKDDPTVDPRPAAELLLTDAIESTSLLNEEVLRTVIAGAEKFKIIRDSGVPVYKTSSNALRVPLGEAEINAPVVSEGAPIPDRTQDYGFRNFTIVKYGMKPRISYEMIEDGLVNVVAEEIFFAGAAVENRLNKDAIMNLVANKGNVNTYAAGRTSATAGNSLPNIMQTKALLKADGFFADTIIMCTDMEYDLQQNANVLQAERFGGSEVIRKGMIPTFLGMNVFVTDNGADTAANWRYTTDNDTAAIVMEARRGCGIAMRRDRTVKKFDDVEKELQGITVTMRSDVSYLHANAVGTVTYQSS